MTSKILMIAPSSIPLNGAEAIVNTKLLELLTNNNFKIDLISKKHKWEEYPLQNNLNELNIKLNNIKTVEVDNKLNFKTVMQHLFTYIIFGTVFKGAHWAYVVYFNNKQFFKNNNYDYVLTKDAPSYLLGYLLKKKYKYKWVASWNDPYPGLKYPEPYGKGVNAQLPWYQKKVLKIMENADFHIFPSVRLKDYMQQYLKISECKILIAPHIVFENHKRSKSKSDFLRILHSGNVKNPRDPKLLILALKKLKNENPDLKISMDFLGVYDDDLKDVILKNNLTQYVNLLPPVKYKDNINSLSNYDLAMIIEAKCEEGIFLPTKVGDYMQSHIPIFSISPKIGLLNDLFKEGYIQYFSTNEVNEIYAQLKIIYNDFLNANIKESIAYKPFFAERILEIYKSI